MAAITHGSPATATGKLEELQNKTGAASITLHFPPRYGAAKALASLELFAGEVMPKLRDKQHARKLA